MKASKWLLMIVLSGAVVLACVSKLLAADDDPITAAMEEMNKSYKVLKAQVADPSKNQSSLELVWQMQKQALVSKGLTPIRAGKTPEGERLKFITEYRKAMIALMGDLLKLETALLEGKNGDADTMVKNLVKSKNDAHEKFQEE